MAITLTGTVTGTAVTGFTSPTYTLSADVAPEVNAKQAAVTTIGGTQNGVVSHSIASPFTVTFMRPKVFNTAKNVAGGKTQLNKYTLLIRKGMIVDGFNQVRTGNVRITVEIPNGSEDADAPAVKAMMSLASGCLVEDINDLITAAITGVM